MDRERNDYLTDVAKAVVDDLLADRNEWLKLYPGPMEGLGGISGGAEADIGWNEMVGIVRDTLIDRMSEVMCSG